MISRIRGSIKNIRDLQVLIDVQGVCYEVLAGPSIIKGIQERLQERDGDVELVTFHYHQLEPGRGIPVLIGFLNEVEREFFLQFISVSGIGPRAALKAFTQPIPVIAKAIDEGNISFLRSLPGIGEQRAKEIVAKLQGKVGKFGLIQTRGETDAAQKSAAPDIEAEAIAVLIQLEYKSGEARQMVKAAIGRNPQLKNAEELLNEVYRQQRLVAEPV